jgi:mono/diheme cytochrome c family protein
VNPLSKRSRPARCNRMLFLFTAILIVVPMASAQEALSPAEASFQDRLRPLIFKNCQGCHTFGGHAGGLRLDSFDSLLKGGDRGPSVIRRRACS